MANKKMTYGKLTPKVYDGISWHACRPVRLGNSGLKVSRIILGTMSYGSSDWYPWVLNEEEGIKHIKYA